jgi:hypothetical protein
MGSTEMKWLGDLFALAWAVSILLVIFLGPFVAVAVLISYLWGMI